VSTRAPTSDLEPTLTQLLHDVAERYSATELIDSARRLDVRTFEHEVSMVSGALAACDVRAGDHVGLWMTNSIDWLAIWFAVARLGATLVPLNTRTTLDEIEDVLRRSRTSLLVAEPGSATLDDIAVERLTTALPNLQACWSRRSDDRPTLLARQADPPPPPAETPNQVGMIQYTSGSTAAPKGAQLRNGALVRNARGLASAWHLGPSDRALCANPLFHCGGSVFSFLSAFSSGASVVLLPHWSVTDAAAVMSREHVTVLAVIDTMVRDLLGYVRAVGDRPTGLRLVAVPADPALLQEIAATLECDVSNVYGLTEASPNVAVGDLSDSQENRIRSIGFPQPGLEVEIRDPASRAAVPTGATGIITVRGWSVMSGYYDDPAGTAATIDGHGFLWTGDLGSLDENGRLHYHGRQKQMIKSGGENVSIEEVETCLRTHPAVADAVVVPVPDARLSEVGFAYLRLHPGQHTDADEILRYCRDHMAGFKVPRHARIVHELPRVGSGKVDRRALRDAAIEDRAGTSS
jgi:fatty-acyl-CoA synthase